MNARVRGFTFVNGTFLEIGRAFFIQDDVLCRRDAVGGGREILIRRSSYPLD